MDLVKIGNFISETRKQKGLTQKELADKLHLSNRTISKWECGKGIPDSSVMIELCDILGISVNELLSGEHLSDDNYIIRADENVIALIQHPQDSYKKELVSAFRSITLGIIFFLFIIFCIYLNVMGAAHAVDYIDFPSFLIIFGAICITLITTGLHKDFLKAVRLSIFSSVRTTSKEIRRAIISVKITALAALLSGIILAIASTISALTYTSPNHILALPVALAISMLGILYGFVIALLMIPLIAKLHIMQIEKEEEDL